MAGSQTRSHTGHHHHHHHHDNIYLTSTNKNDAAVRITRIGLFCNFGMFAAKLAGGMAFHSQAMVADAWHSFSDLGSDLLTWLTVSSSLKPPNETYPLGFGKVESLGALGVSGMLLFSGCYMFIGSSQALLTLWSPETQELLSGVVGHVHAHSHSHSHDHGGAPSLHAAWLAAGTVLVKEWLYHASKYSCKVN
jgi:divalent metal cation (Fe/Co/Zn/Cd) transporter